MNNFLNSKIFKVIMIILAIALLLFSIGWRLNLYNEQDTIQNKMNEAERLEEIGDYWNAYLIYSKLKDERVSAEVRANMIYPKAAMNRGVALFYSDNKFNAIPYLIDAANEGISEAEDLLYELLTDYLNNKEY